MDSEKHIVYEGFFPHDLILAKTRIFSPSPRNSWHVIPQSTFGFTEYFQIRCTFKVLAHFIFQIMGGLREYFTEILYAEGRDGYTFF